MKRFLARLVLVSMATACVGAGTALSPTPQPTTPVTGPFVPLSPPASPVEIPSSSCIFILNVSNESSGPIDVQINDTRIATIPSQESKQFMDHSGLPEMPWHVLLVRTAGGATLGESNFTSDQLEGRMTARDQGWTADSRNCSPA